MAGLGLDFVDGSGDLDFLTCEGMFSVFENDKKLIAGVVNGRNIWKVTASSWRTLEHLLDQVPLENLILSTSCSLAHVPLSVKDERQELHDKFRFALEKLDELRALARALTASARNKVNDESHRCTQAAN